MKNIETTSLQAISGGSLHALEVGERVIYNDSVRPTVAKESAMSGVLFGSITYFGVAAVSASCITLAPAIPFVAAAAIGAGVAGYEYQNHDLWFKN